MIVSFIVFLVLFLGGIWAMGIAQSLPDFQSLVFIAGLLAVSAALAVMMRERGGATRRTDSWNRKSGK